MAEEKSVLQVNTTDARGGAARVAWNLYRGYGQSGWKSWMAVGEKLGKEPGIFQIPNNGNGMAGRICSSLGNLIGPLAARNGVMQNLQGGLGILGDTRRFRQLVGGREVFEFPGTWNILNLPPSNPDVVQCHNLHGFYFDLRALPSLAGEASLVLTLHDSWMLTGHCVHSLDCEKWRTGCGRCPYPRIESPLLNDATSYNWRRKKRIFDEGRFYIATPSRWLMEKVERSILANSCVESRVVPNGVDLGIFHPGNRSSARDMLKVDSKTKVLLFAADGIRGNVWKDFDTLRRAISLLASRTKSDLLFIALGEDSKPERVGSAEIRFVPYKDRAEDVAQFYWAADVYVHASRVDTFPNSILEALSCGTPVVATAVGGIPEQVRDGVTGYLVPPGDAERMADLILRLLEDGDNCQRFGENAAEIAKREFDLKLQIERYLSWFNKIR